MAPEVFGYPQSAGYDERVDIWSIGCVVLQMITGKRNFWEPSQYESLILQNGMAFNPQAPTYYRSDLSDDLVDFLNCCFEIKKEDRSSASQLLQHQFLTKI